MYSTHANHLVKQEKSDLDTHLSHGFFSHHRQVQTEGLTLGSGQIKVMRGDYAQSPWHL